MKLHKIISIIIALVWLINGLVCKLLNLVPRHEQIVARILDTEHSRIITVLIGIAEIGMAVWILTGYKPKWSAWLQITVVMVMNILETLLAPDLLLWGRWNMLFALFFVSLVYFHACMMVQKPNTQHG